MREVVAIRHLSFEHLGTLAPSLSGRGFRIRYLDAGISDLSALDVDGAGLVVILGGPIGAYEESDYPFLAEEIRLIERRLRSGKPMLGICLGAQLIARAMGSRVYAGREKEIGWAPVHLTPEGQESDLAALRHCDYQVLHWHGDTFDLPDGAVRLASTEATENQAFCVGDKVLGLQFHLELDPAEIERWLIGHAHEIAAAPHATPTAIREDTARRGPALARSAGRFMQHWLRTSALLPAESAG